MIITQKDKEKLSKALKVCSENPPVVIILTPAAAYERAPQE